MLLRLPSLDADVQLTCRATHAAKVLVQELHEAMDDLQCDQFVVLLLNGTAKVQAGVPAGEAGGGRGEEEKKVKC